MPMSHVYFFFGGAQSIAKYDEGSWPIIVHWIRLCWYTSPPCDGTTPTLPETSTDGDTTTARTVDVTEIARSYYFDDIVSSYMGPIRCEMGKCYHTFINPTPTEYPCHRMFWGPSKYNN